jgi:hypothetical protein
MFESITVGMGQKDLAELLEAYTATLLDGELKDRVGDRSRCIRAMPGGGVVHVDIAFPDWFSGTSIPGVVTNYTVSVDERFLSDPELCADVVRMRLESALTELGQLEPTR